MIKNLNFDENTCFLSGEDLPIKETLTIFPEWMMDRFGLRDKQFKLMDKMKEVSYENLNLPCSPVVKQKFDELEKEVKTAFEGGYESLKVYDSYKLFIWMGKIVYGILYHDLVMEKKLKEKLGTEMDISPVLQERFRLFHLMLQSFIAPITFTGEYRPWSISVVRLKYSKDICNYRDDSVNMIFSLGINGFGIIGCLMDNGSVVKEHQYLIDKIGDTVLHPIQFEELCARFQYSSYLLAYKPTYHIQEVEEGLEIEALPIVSDGKTPVFGKWDEEMFASLLAEYFKPWGLTKNEIITTPNSPISFLENEVTYEFISPESVKLPF